MNGRITKVSYARSALENATKANIKQVIRKKITDIISLLPQQMFVSLHSNVCPELIKQKRLVAAILRGADNVVSLDTSYMFDIKHTLPPIGEIIKDDEIVCDDMMKKIEKYRDMLSQQAIDHIHDKIQDFLARRKTGIEMFYKNHSAPEYLLKRLLFKYNDEEQDDDEQDDEKDIDVYKGYLDNNNMQIYLDSMYGSIYLLMAPDFFQKYKIKSAGTFGKEYLMGENEEVFVDDEEENIVVPSCKEVYFIFSQGNTYTDDIITHERQHLINDIIGEYDTEDFLVSAQNEIVAYIKQKIDHKGTIYMMQSAENYKYYQETLDQKERHLKTMEERLIQYKKNKTNKTPKIIIKGLEQDIKRNTENIQRYKEKNTILREEYLANIGEYIDIAYKFQGAGIPNYITILAMTPIRQWKSLLKTYNVQ